MPDDYGVDPNYNHGAFVRQQEAQERLQAREDKIWMDNWKLITPLPPMQSWQREDAAKKALAYHKQQQQIGYNRGGRRMRYKSTRRRSKSTRRRVKTHRRRHRKH